MCVSLLADPHFVRAFDVGDYVYLFFREQAAEEILSTRIYSRVARVCKVSATISTLRPH